MPFPHRRDLPLNRARASGVSRGTRPGTTKEPRRSATPRWPVFLPPCRTPFDVTGLSGATVTLSIPDGARIAKKDPQPPGGSRERDLGARVDRPCRTLGTITLKSRCRPGSVAQKMSSSRPGRVGLRYSRLLFPDHEVVLVGGRIKEALAAARGNVILCGLPALILKYIEPHILDGTGYATVEELSASPAFLAVCGTGPCPV